MNLTFRYTLPTAKHNKLVSFNGRAAQVAKVLIRDSFYVYLWSLYKPHNKNTHSYCLEKPNYVDTSIKVRTPCSTCYMD